MRTISCKLEDLKNMTLHIGYEGENDYTSVRIDAGSVFAEYPEAVATMKVQPPKGNMYPVIVSREGDIVVWNVKDSDTASNGNGEIQLTFTEGTVVRKSCTGKTIVHRSLKATGHAPDPLEDFIETAEEVLDDLEAMDTIAKNAQAGDIGKALSPKTVENGVVTEWQYVEPGGGTEDYDDLDNKPAIGGVTLSGDKSLTDLGIASADSVSELSGDVADVKSEIHGVEENANTLKSEVQVLELDTSGTYYDKKGEKENTGTSGGSIPESATRITVDLKSGDKVAYELIAPAGMIPVYYVYFNGSSNYALKYANERYVEELSSNITQISYYVESCSASGNVQFNVYKVNEQEDSIKENVDLIRDDVYEYNAIPVNASPEGWRLNETNGLCSSNGNYKLVKYIVTAGDRVKVVSDDRFQFQTIASVPSSGVSNRVGKTYQKGTYYLIVPQTATYLIISTLINGSTAGAYTLGSRIDDFEVELSVYDTELNIGEAPSKNLNTIPYYGNAEHTQNGVTFAVNSDNSISLSGVSSGDAFLVTGDWNKGKRVFLPAGTYTLSSKYYVADHVYCYINFYSSQEASSTARTAEYAYRGKVTFTTDTDYYVVVNATVDSGNDVNDKTMYLQIEAGNNETEYVSPWPYKTSLRLKGIDDDVEKLQNEMLEVKPARLDVPFYYHAGNYLYNKCNRLNSLARGCSGVSDTFAFVTDLHWHLNAKKSPALLKYIKEQTRIDKLFCGGDICDFITSEKQPYDAFTNFVEAWGEPIYTAIGNHEYMSEYGTDGRAYYSFNSIGKDRIGNMERQYFYVDNPQTKIRYIFLTAYKRGNNSSADAGYEADQLTWLSNVALNMETGWGAVIITHMTHALSGTTPVIASTAAPMIEILDNYNGNGEIIAVISGHTHYDYLDHSDGGIPIIVTTCDKYYPWMSGVTNNEPWLSDRVEGTKTEQVIDLFLIDRTAKTITRVRVGCPIHYGIDPEAWTDYEDVTTSYDRS